MDEYIKKRERIWAV